ncbi:hypothetical protein FF1_030579 [Malus domestica]
MRNYVQRKEKREIGANRGTVTIQHWQRKFMNSGNEIEHKAFRVFLLRNYVFVCNRSMIYNDVISVAIHLARGTRIALTPAVLASIYKDLGVLKKAIVWAWERFSDLRPENPNHLNNGEPRMARWDKVDVRNVGTTR